MYACVCRAIKESDYETSSDLINRLYQDDLVCGTCIRELNKLKDKPKTFMGAWTYYSMNKENNGNS